MKEHNAKLTLVSYGDSHIEASYSQIVQKLNEDLDDISFSHNHYRRPEHVVESISESKYDTSSIILVNSPRVFNALARNKLHSQGHSPSKDILSPTYIPMDSDFETEKNNLKGLALKLVS